MYSEQSEWEVDGETERSAMEEGMGGGTLKASLPLCEDLESRLESLLHDV